MRFCLSQCAFIPPLVASIVDGHQVGVIVPMEELMNNQEAKWHVLEKTPLYALANPFWDSEAKLIAAGKALLEKGGGCVDTGLPRFPSASP